MYELLEAYGGESLANNVFDPSAITPADLADPYKVMDYTDLAMVFDSILLNVDSLEGLCLLNIDLKMVNPWGLGEVFAAQARSATQLEYWARLQSVARLMVGPWKSSLRDDGETVTLVSDWSHHRGVGFSTLGACFAAHRIKDTFGVAPISMRMPYHAGQTIKQRLAAEFPDVEIEFEPPVQTISYRRSEIMAAPPIPRSPRPPITYRDLLEAYYPDSRRRAALRVLEATESIIAAGLEPSLESIAGEAGIQPRQLQRALASGGLTMRSIIERIRVANAEELLADSADSILDIALATGYTSHQALTKVFKRWRGLAPTEYRFYVEQNRPAPSEIRQQA